LTESRVPYLLPGSKKRLVARSMRSKIFGDNLLRGISAACYSAGRRVTLIHEVAHMPATFGTKGPGELYGLWNVKRNVSPHTGEALKNSDCIAGYVFNFDDV